MKLLIVDDEELTRTGVISSIDWTALGIHEIYQADDGIHGLEAAKLYRPEIILCDVRMPRMDGIAMLEQIETFLPGIVPIFMSGYSDKEYLKAAIKLKAVSYIEKPINPAEVQEAILEAIELSSSRARSSRGETFHSMETASRIALQLTVPYGTNGDIISRLSEELSLTLNENTCFTSFIIRLESMPDFSEQALGEIYHTLKEYANTLEMDCFYAEKHGQYIVYFLYGTHMLTPEEELAAGRMLDEQYASVSRHFVAVGETVIGLENAYRSYASAVILLQSSFFFAPGTLLTMELIRRGSLQERILFATPEADFAQSLSAKDQTACQAVLDRIYQYFYQNCVLLQNQAKDLYYKLFLALGDARRQIVFQNTSGEETIADTMDRCFTYQELHGILLEKVGAFFDDLHILSKDSPTILLIKDYISKNYGKETLSVKDISAHVFLSASYVCTYFKNETGQTLNQYLTEYRMEKAKQLLADPRYKITDISSKVGYSDGNYFGKSFKKYCGLSPSEFREKTIR